MTELIQKLKELELSMREHLPEDLLNEFRTVLILAEIDSKS